MKKLLILFGLALFVQAAYAQLELKPAVGINWMALSGDPDNGEFSAQVGWQAGASVLFGQKFYGEAGIFWHSRTTEFSSDNVEELNFDQRIQGLRIPVMGGVHLLGNEESLAALRIFGGGSAFFVTNTSGDIDKGDIESPQWGLFAGAGLDLWIFFIDAKYEWSLTNFSSVDSIGSIDNIDIGKNRGFFANFGVRIRI